MEPNYSLTNILILLPFGAYYLGILIRRYAFPDDFTSTLGRQFLLGLPMSIAVVVPLCMTVIPSITSVLGYVSMIGLVIEQGMVLNETVISRLKPFQTPQLAGAVTNNGTTSA